nr:MAG TPA: hypothetical protein [Caudoviricetes sp.]
MLHIIHIFNMSVVLLLEFSLHRLIFHLSF